MSKYQKNRLGDALLKMYRLYQSGKGGEGLENRMIQAQWEWSFGSPVRRLSPVWSAKESVRLAYLHGVQ